METYNDGVAIVFEDITERISFGALRNEGNLKRICKLNYGEMTQRQKDLEFAQQNDFSLSLKVKTPFCSLIERNKKYKVLIKNSLYDVSYYDVTKTKLFFYLEYIREVDEDFGAEDTSTDS